MYKILRADKDTYITNRVISGERVERANVGSAGTLDLFKLYGATSSGTLPNTELSRLLLHFDLTDLKSMASTGKVDINSTSFECRLVLKDVYGGQTTPSNFTVAVFPLSRSFDEGIGRDIVYYSDEDVCNFLSSSRVDGAWLLSGCSLAGDDVTDCDYVTGSGGSLKSTQLFVTGEENLDVDVTNIVKAIINETIPDAGFRISLDAPHEQDNRSYFVKRFSARTAYDQSNRPELVVKFDDSIQDDTQLITFDDDYTLFFYNYSRGALANVMSASTALTGTNCIALKMSTEVSGGWYDLSFVGSQHMVGTTPVVGIYSASIDLSSTDSVIKTKLNQSGTIDFVPVWGSLDGTVGFLTGSRIFINKHAGSSVNLSHARFIVTAYGMKSDVLNTERLHIKVNLFDQQSPAVRASRTFMESPGAVVRDVHYSVRNVDTNKVVIPFDAVKNSTRLSSDARGMWFNLDVASLPIDQRYVIDIMIITNDSSTLFQDASSIFRVAEVG
jgi:hypothetical protein